MTGFMKTDKYGLYNLFLYSNYNYITRRGSYVTPNLI